ncbi:tetratricopeptide repeat protein [Bacteroidaceae bacterium HV4-6-C5C]|nr:tetratricopeptide repeat protein [Bacteroidaceae bacterium HV4-6-C5C]
MTSAFLNELIQHPENLNRETLYELRTLVARYPYFHSLRLLYLKNLYLLHDISFGSELRKAVLFVADRRMLFYVIEGDRYALKPQTDKQMLLQSVEKEDVGLDRTLSLIDAFLSTIPEEETRTDLDYSTDYTNYLLKEDGGDEKEVGSLIIETEDMPKLRGHDLIDGFIQRSSNSANESVELSENKILPLLSQTESDEEDQETTSGTSFMADEAGEQNDITDNEKEQPERVQDSSYELDDSCFTETLAKIYIKQHKYEKALEIIKKLSLNYPKKNAYFADQIRFLEKLIINAKSK